MASCRFVLFVNVLFFNFRITVTGKFAKGNKRLVGCIVCINPWTVLLYISVFIRQLICSFARHADVYATPCPI